jgi:hypothetical protein
VKNSKKAARSLRTRTAGRSVSHAGRGETRFPAADGLGRRGLVYFVRSGKLPSGSFLSAFIGGQYGVFAFALDRERSTSGRLRCCDPAAQVALPESPLLCRAPGSEERGDGHAFQSPFASPPGVGLSSSMVNVLGGFFNLAGHPDHVANACPRFRTVPRGAVSPMPRQLRGRLRGLCGWACGPRIAMKPGGAVTVGFRPCASYNRTIVC